MSWGVWSRSGNKDCWKQSWRHRLRVKSMAGLPSVWFTHLVTCRLRAFVCLGGWKHSIVAVSAEVVNAFRMFAALIILRRRGRRTGLKTKNKWTKYQILQQFSSSAVAPGVFRFDSIRFVSFLLFRRKFANLKSGTYKACVTWKLHDWRWRSMQSKQKRISRPIIRL